MSDCGVSTYKTNLAWEEINSSEDYLGVNLLMLELFEHELFCYTTFKTSDTNRTDMASSSSNTGYWIQSSILGSGWIISLCFDDYKSGWQTQCKLLCSLPSAFFIIFRQHQIIVLKMGGASEADLILPTHFIVVSQGLNALIF